MSFVDTLVAAWTNPTQPPPGVTGAALTGGMTTQQKLDAVNAWTVVVPRPAQIPVSSIIAAIDPADFGSLTQLQTSKLALLFMGGAMINALPNIRSDFQTIFAGKTTTLNNLSALVAPFDNATQSWSTANGGPAVVGYGEIAGTGLS